MGETDATPDTLSCATADVDKTGVQRALQMPLQTEGALLMQVPFQRKASLGMPVRMQIKLKMETQMETTLQVLSLQVLLQVQLAWQMVFLNRDHSGQLYRLLLSPELYICFPNKMVLMKTLEFCSPPYNSAMTKSSGIARAFQSTRLQETLISICKAT